MSAFKLNKDRGASTLVAEAPARSTRARSPDGQDILIPIGAPLELADHRKLNDRHISVRRFGRRDGPAIIVMGGISSGRKLSGADGWWNGLVGPGAAVDLERYCVLGLDFAPLADEQAALSSHTQAQLIATALDALGIKRLHAIIGASYGAMVALAFGALAPERVKALCLISAAHRPSPLASAWRGVQRRMVEFALEQGSPERGLALARQLAMITYRSPAEFEDRFHNVLGAEGLSDLDRYLVARGEAYPAAMGAKRWLSLSAAIDRHRVTPEQVAVRTTLAACPTDQLIPFSDVEELARRLPSCAALHVVESLYGHDAFLKEHDRIGEIVRGFLRCTDDE